MDWINRPSTEIVYLNIGLDFLSEFKLADAINFVNNQIKILDDMIEDKKQRAIILEQNIHLALTNNGFEK